MAILRFILALVLGALLDGTLAIANTTVKAIINVAKAVATHVVTLVLKGATLLYLWCKRRIAQATFALVESIQVVLDGLTLGAHNLASLSMTLATLVAALSINTYNNIKNIILCATTLAILTATRAYALAKRYCLITKALVLISYRNLEAKALEYDAAQKKAAHAKAVVAQARALVAQAEALCAKAQRKAARDAFWAMIDDAIAAWVSSWFVSRTFAQLVCEKVAAIEVYNFEFEYILAQVDVRAQVKTVVAFALRLHAALNPKKVMVSEAIEATEAVAEVKKPKAKKTKTKKTKKAASKR